MKILYAIVFMWGFLVPLNAQVKTENNNENLKLVSDSLSKRLLQTGEETAKYLSTLSEKKKDGSKTHSSFNEDISPYLKNPLNTPL